MAMTRDEHLAWCKKRALEYVDTGETQNAVASMLSDLNKHEGTRLNPMLQGTLMMAAMMDVGQPDRIREWVLGFN